MPLEDRSFAADPGGTPHAATRWAWYGFPVLAVLVLALTILLVMVPIERKLG